MKPYYQDEWVTIYHGDCREILPQLPKVDLVLTDPPYFLPNTQFRPEMRMASRMWSNFSFAQVAFEQYLKLILAIAKEDFEFYLFTDEVSYPVVYPLLYSSFYQTKAIVWDKGSIGLGGKWRRQFEFILYSHRGNPDKSGSHSDIIKCKRGENKEHPYEKPVELLRAILELSMPDLTVDPFMGVGSTLVASKSLNRKCIGIEIEEKYCEIAAKRYSQGVMELKVLR